MRSKKSAIHLSHVIISFIITLFSIAVMYPFLYSLAYSLSDSVAVATRNVTIFPVGFTPENYVNVFQNHRIYNSFYISVARTIGGALWTLFVTGLASYAISKRQIPFNRLIAFFLIIPMYVTGGLIPTYVLMFKLQLYNNFLVYILPHGFWAFNMLLMRTYFDTIPPEMEESARLDGAGDLRIFLRIILPVSMPIVAVIAMYAGVWQWNSWFDAMLYVTRPELKPLQAVLQQMILESYTSMLQLAQGGQIAEKQASPEGIRMATMMVTVIPIIIVYPFFQKHFVRGVMIGAVKA